MVNNIKWRCIYGRSSEDKHSIKNSIQSTMKLKSFIQRLPLALFKKTCQSWDYMYWYGLEMILMDKNIKCRYISGRSSEANIP